MWASTAPAAITNLFAACDAAPDLTSVQCFDGPVLAGETLTESLTIGWVGDGDETAAEGAARMEGLAGNPDREQFAVKCRCRVLRGDGNIQAARARAFQILAEVGKIVAADRTLDGAVMVSNIGEWSLAVAQPKIGAVAMLTFDVDCDAFTDDTP